MDLADLALLQAVADRGSFSSAAAAMRLSQPSVSARVAAIERSVGATLFSRDSRGARLTPAGARYLSFVRRSLRLLDEGARAATAESPHPVLRVGAPASYAPAMAPLLLRAAARIGHAVTLHTGHSGQLRTDVLDGQLDIAIVSPGPQPPSLISNHLLHTPVIAAASGRIRPPPQGYAIHSFGPSAEAVTTELLGRSVPRSDIAIVSPASAAVTLAVYHHRIAVIPRIAAIYEFEAGDLVPVALDLPQVTASLEWVRPLHTRTASLLSDLMGGVETQLPDTHS